MTRDSLYLKVDDQKAYQDVLKKGNDLLRALPQDTRDSFVEALRSGKPKTIEALTKVFIRRGVDPVVLKRGFDAFSRISEFQKEQGGEPSESVNKVAELIKAKLSEQGKDN